MRGMEIDLVGAFLALGVPLPEVIRESTTNPATERPRANLSARS